MIFNSSDIIDFSDGLLYDTTIFNATMHSDILSDFDITPDSSYYKA